MAIITETTDAATGLDTIYTLEIGDTFIGSVAGSDEVDRVLVILQAGASYTASLSGLYGGTSNGSLSIANFDQGVTSWSLSYADGSTVGQITDLDVIDNGDGWLVSFIAPLSGTYSFTVDDNQDTTAEAYEISIAIVAEPTTEVFFDQDNTEPWSIYANTYDANGDLIERGIIYDDERRVTTSYVDGTKSTQTVENFGNAYPWTVIEKTFDTNGLISEAVRTYDDGRIVVASFEDGQRISQTYNDIEDVRDWTRYTDTFDSDGNRVARLELSDNSLQIQTSYLDDTKATQTVTDISDNFSWSEVQKEFDTSGTLTETIRTYDDGIVLLSDFENGNVVTETFTDAADIKGWDSYVRTFDEAGNRISRITTFDDGTIETRFFDRDIITFDNGVLTNFTYSESNFTAFSMQGDFVTPLNDIDDDRDYELGQRDIALGPLDDGIRTAVRFTKDDGDTFDFGDFTLVNQGGSDLDGGVQFVGLNTNWRDGGTYAVVAVTNDEAGDLWELIVVSNDPDVETRRSDLSKNEILDYFVDIQQLQIRIDVDYSNTETEDLGNGIGIDDLIFV